jgi:hypothetical protein
MLLFGRLRLELGGSDAEHRGELADLREAQLTAGQGRRVEQ